MIEELATGQIQKKIYYASFSAKMHFTFATKESKKVISIKVFCFSIAVNSSYRLTKNVTYEQHHFSCHVVATRNKSPRVRNFIQNYDLLLEEGNNCVVVR